MLKVISVLLLAALLVGCTNTEEAPEPTATLEPFVSPTPGTSTATATPTATPEPTPIPIPTKTFTTQYEVCEDLTETWYCLTDNGLVTCTLTGINAPSYTPSEITVTCFNFDSLEETEEFVIRVGDSQ
ncbi:hypothetical protein ACFLQ2_00810 [archaeon]